MAQSDLSGSNIQGLFFSKKYLIQSMNEPKLINNLNLNIKLKAMWKAQAIYKYYN